MQKDKIGIRDYFFFGGIYQFQRGGWEIECFLIVFKKKDGISKETRSFGEYFLFWIEILKVVFQEKENLEEK